MTHKIIKTDNYLLVVSDEYIKDVRHFMGRWHLEDGRTLNMFPDYLTDLSVCKLVIAHLPLDGSLILEGIPLLPPIEDDVYELAEQSWECCQTCTETDKYMYKNGYVHGYNNAKSVHAFNIKELSQLMHDAYSLIKGFSMDEVWSEWDESVKQRVYDMLVKIQSLHRYPTEFECEMEDYCGSPFTTESCPKCIDSCDRAYQKPKTIITAQGIQWVGKYK